MMDDNNKASDAAAVNDNAPEAEAEAEAEAATENTAEIAVAAAAEESLAARLAKAEAEAADFKDRALRALAEVENVRRRAQREREDASKFAIGNFAKDLLSVADNLRRALESVPEEQIKDDAMRNLLAGVAATERELLAAFDRHRLRKIDPKGEKFDHNFHQAMFEVDNSGQPPGTIVQVLQPGYVLNDRLLRPAMVGVARGEAKPGEHVDTMA
jgi:molecular chaperone GrpE